MSKASRPPTFERKEALIIINPAAHNAESQRRMEQMYMAMQAEGWQITWENTSQPGDALTAAARAAEQRVPLVFACGGDGTVNEVANGLAHSDSALGTIPTGTSNIWAREIGLTKKPWEAGLTTIYGERRLVDLGKAGDRYFLMMAGFGIDAAVTQKVHLGVKDRVGAAAYALAAAREALTWRGKPIAVRIDGVERQMDVLMAFVGNTRLYAGITQITPTAIVNDGRLEVCIYSGRGKRDIMAHLARTLLQLHRKSENVFYRRAKRIEFDWNEPLPVQLDGDPLGDCPREVVVDPGAIWVVVPSGFTSPLFGEPDGPESAEELSLPQPHTG